MKLAKNAINCLKMAYTPPIRKWELATLKWIHSSDLVSHYLDTISWKKFLILVCLQLSSLLEKPTMWNPCYVLLWSTWCLVMGMTWDSSFLCSIEYPSLNYFSFIQKTLGFINMQATKHGLLLLFGYGNELGQVYKSPSLVWRNKGWWWWFGSHIK